MKRGWVASLTLKGIKRRRRKLAKEKRTLVRQQPYDMHPNLKKNQVLTSGNMTLSPKALSAGKCCCQKDNCIWKQISKLIETAAVWQELQRRANTSWQSNHYSWCTWSWSEKRSPTNTLTYQNSFKYRNKRIQHISMK